MGWALGSLLAVLYVAGRDATRVSFRALTMMVGMLAVALLVLVLLEELVSRISRSLLSERAWRLSSSALIAVPPLVLAAARWWPARAAAPPWAPVALIAAAVLAVAVAFPAIWRAGMSPSDHPGPARAFFAAVLASGFIALHLSEGTLQAVREGTGALHVFLLAGTWTGSAVLLIPLGARSGRLHRGERGSPRSWLLLLSLILALCLIEADRRLLVGLHPAVHVWLGGLGFLCMDTALAGAASRWTRRAVLRAGAWAAAVLAVACVSTLARAGRLRDPGLRAELGSSASGSWFLDVLGSPEVLAPRGRVARHPALSFDQYLNEKPELGRPNLLLVTVDALRADQVGPAGSPNPLAPKLERFARSAVRFRRAYAQGTRTAIAMSALMLGRYSANIDWKPWVYRGGRLYDPRKLGARTLASFRGKYVYTTLPVFPRGTTLAERLSRAGFTTVAVPYAGRNEFFRRGTGFDRGFSRFVDLSRKTWSPPTSDRVVKLALAELDKLRGERWFLWVHLYDTHESRMNRARYDRFVRAVDTALGKLLESIERRGRDRTAVVVLSDHGEAFGEHRHKVHGTSLYDEEARIPLLVRVPGVAPRDEERSVAALDVTATLLALGGADTGGLDGVNLVPLLTRGAYPRDRPVFSELHRYLSNKGKRTADLKGIVLGDGKLVVDRSRATAELFDLGEDPGELTNLVSRRGADYDRLYAILESFVCRAEQAHPLP